MTTPQRRPGVTLPLPGHLHEQREQLAGLADLGFTNVWSLEADSSDAFTPLVLAAAWEPRLHLGTAIIPAFTRGPAVLAQSAAALADAAPGRVTIGIGTSSNVIVEAWNGLAFENPYGRVRDVIRFLKDSLGGQRVARSYDTFAVDGFTLRMVPEIPPPIIVAALRPGMLRLAGREADGAVLSWLSPDDVRTVGAIVRAHGEDKQLVCRVLVSPIADPDVARSTARRSIAAYMNVPVYRAFQEWLGRGPELREMWDKWDAGDRKGALQAIPDSVVDELIVHGPPEVCRAKLDAYFDAGVSASSISMLLPPDVEFWSALEGLSPRLSEPSRV